MTAPSRRVPVTVSPSDACCEGCADAAPAAATRQRQLDMRRARWLAWGSLVWMTAEGGVGLAAGLAAGSVALTGWALGSVIEGLASVIVIWRFTGTRALSETAERRAGRAVAVSFWLLAPWIAVQAVLNLAGNPRETFSAAGIALTAASVIVMPALGAAKRRLGRRLGSGATAGEGTQNLMCAAQAAAVLAGLAVVAVWPGAWPADPAVALGITAWSVWEGRQSWRGANCC